MLSVEQRLDRIETMLASAARRERLWRRAALASSGLLLVGVCGALAAPEALMANVAEVVRTSRLEVVGADGKAVLVATGSAHGGQLDIWSRGGANTLRLGSGDFGGDLVLWNEKGEQIASAFATADGGRFEAFWANGTPGFTAGVSRDKGAAMSIANSSGKEVLYAGSNTAGAGLVRVGHASGMTAAAIASEADGGVFEAFSAAGDSSAPLAVIGAGNKGVSGILQISSTAASGSSAAGDGASSAGSASPGNGTRPVFEVDARSDGAGRVMVGSGGDANVVLEAGPQDTGLLSFFTKGQRVAALGCGVAGGQMNLGALDGRPVVVLGAASDGQGGGVTVRGADGQPVVRASVDSRGDGEVVVYSSNGQRKRVINSE